MVYKFKKNLWVGPICLQIKLQLKMRIFQTKNQLKNYTNQLLKSQEKKVRSPFINNTWGADLADMQLTNKFDKGIRF